MPQPTLELGFRIVHRPRSPTADLIFIHGLNGHRNITWTTKSGEFWLPWLGRHLPDVRVWTYGYNADLILDLREALDLYATQFLSNLSSCLSDDRSNDVVEKPIVFVTHDLGGILVKKAMILASSTRSEWNSIFQNAAGIVFLGTPHRSSSSANGPGFLIRSTLRLPVPPLLRLLRANTSLLAQIADRFNNIWGRRRVFTFIETNATICFVVIVPKKDAITNCQGEQIHYIPKSNHTKICKPDSTRSILFTKLLYVIQSLLPQPELRDKQRPTGSPSVTPPRVAKSSRK